MNKNEVTYITQRFPMICYGFNWKI